VHIPRTGGTSLELSLAAAFPDAIHHPEHEHLSALETRRLLPGPNWKLFTIVRNPWDVFRSHYQLVLETQDTPPDKWPAAQKRRFKVEAGLSFAEYVLYCVRRGWPARSGGLVDTFCDLRTKIFRYECSPFLQIGTWLNCELAAHWVNRSDASSPSWDDMSAALVGWHCRHDVQRFGYQSPIDWGSRDMLESVC
jgi:hypothetical protein